MGRCSRRRCIALSHDADETPRLRSRLLFFGAFVVLVVVALLTLPGIDQIRDRLSSADRTWVAAAVLFCLASRLAYALTLWAAFDRRLEPSQAIVVGFAEQGANVLVPSGGMGGPAFGALAMRRAGAPPHVAAEAHAVLFLATSLASFAGLSAAGILLAAGVLPGGRSTWSTLGPALVAMAILAAAAAAATRPIPSDLPGGLRGAIRGVTTFVHTGARSTLRQVRDGDGALLLGALAYYAFDVAALAAIFAAVGGPVPAAGILVISYTLGQAGSLLPTPGGLGGTEGALIGMLAAYGVAPALATAAVLGHRIFQLGIPAVLGAAALLIIRRRPETLTIADGTA